ncbi:MAG: hypothetical protein ABI461_22215, partial [Polyangiaceae bacterium]
MRVTSLVGSSSRAHSVAYVVFVSMLAAACGSSPPPAPAAEPIAIAPKKRADPPKGAQCTGKVDVTDLFARNAKAFG